MCRNAKVSNFLGKKCFKPIFHKNSFFLKSPLLDIFLQKLSYKHEIWTTYTERDFAVFLPKVCLYERETAKSQQKKSTSKFIRLYGSAYLVKIISF